MGWGGRWALLSEISRAVGRYVLKLVMMAWTGHVYVTVKVPQVDVASLGLICLSVITV